jgi:SAM-dependent methyltransferase
MLKKIASLYKSGTLGLAIKGEIGDRISTLGSAVGSERLIYNPWTYAIFHRVGLETGPAMIDGILRLFPQIKSVADFGCGTGVYVSEFRKRGIVAEGFEYSPIARKMAHDLSNVDVAAFDLTQFKGAGRTFDLAMSFEVAEHVSPQLGDRLVEIVCQHAPRAVFTAAGVGQAGHGHIHLQPKSYWIERFARHGFRFDAAKTRQLEQHLRAELTRGFWLADNVGVYESQRI